MQGQLPDPSPSVGKMEEVLAEWTMCLGKVADQVALICEQEETAKHALAEV